MSVITGQLVGINPAITNGTYTSQKAIFLVNPGQYQSYVEIEFGADKIQLLSGVVVGGHYDVSINIRGSKQMFNSTKNAGHMVAYNSLSAWKIQPQAQTQPQAPVANSFQQPQQQAPAQAFGAPVAQGFNQPQQAPQHFGAAPQQQQPTSFGAPSAAPQPNAFGAPQPGAQPFNNNAGFGGGVVGAPQQQMEAPPF